MAKPGFTSQFAIRMRFLVFGILLVRVIHVHDPILQVVARQPQRFDDGRLVGARTPQDSRESRIATIFASLRIWRAP